MTGTLYIVGTPIGNLEDMTFRAVRVLREVAMIAAEDTRVTRKLLAHFDIATPTMSYHRHSGPAREAQVTALLREGKDVALVSDAGMPGISDPGQTLIAACLVEGIPVIPIPGPSSVITALSVSGFNTDRFRFLGFLPRARKERLALLRDSLAQPDTCAAFEAPHRVTETLADLAALAPAHPVLVARELTKVFEELRRGSAGELAAQAGTAETRGEIVLVWPGGGLAPAPAADPLPRAIAAARDAHAHGASLRDAAEQAAGDFQVSRREVYQALLEEQR